VQIAGRHLCHYEKGAVVQETDDSFMAAKSSQSCNFIRDCRSTLSVLQVALKEDLDNYSPVFRLRLASRLQVTAVSRLNGSPFSLEHLSGHSSLKFFDDLVLLVE